MVNKYRVDGLVPSVLGLVQIVLTVTVKCTGRTATDGSLVQVCLLS